MKCQFGRSCPVQASTELLFTSGMKGRYCTEHAATFDAATVEEATPIDTSPWITSRRVTRRVRISEKNDVAKSMDTSALWASDGLPEWFKPLQPIVEDEAFTSMVINTGGGVHYHITLE